MTCPDDPRGVLHNQSRSDAIVTPWRHGVGTHGDLEPRSTALCGTPGLSMSPVVHGLLISPRPTYKVHSRALEAKILNVQYGDAADWRPPKSGVGKIRGDLATQRGAGDPARGSQGRAQHDLEEGVSTARQREKPHEQQMWRHTSPPHTAGSPGRCANAGHGTSVYLTSGRQRESHVLRW